MKARLLTDLGGLVALFYAALEVGDDELAVIIADEYAESFLEGDRREREMRAESRTYNVRAAHVCPSESMWARLKANGNDMGLLHYLRVTREVLNELAAAVPPDATAWLEGWTDATRTARRPGPPSQMDVQDHLAMALAWGSSQLSQKWLGAIFGTLAAATSTGLMRGIVMLNEALKVIPDAAVRWPTFEEQREDAARVIMWSSEVRHGGERCCCTNGA